MRMDGDGLGRVRRELWHWGRADKRIDELIAEIKIAHSRMSAVYDAIGGGARMDGMPHGTSPGDPVMRAYERIENMRRLFMEEIEACEQEMREEQRFKDAMRDAMRELKPVEQDVLRNRYKLGHSWEYIGLMLHMDERTARRYDESACEKLAEKMIFHDPYR